MRRSSRVVYDVIRDCPYEGASSHVIPVAYGRISNAHPSRGWGGDPILGAPLGGGPMGSPPPHPPTAQPTRNRFRDLYKYNTLYLLYANDA